MRNARRENADVDTTDSRMWVFAEHTNGDGLLPYLSATAKQKIRMVHSIRSSSVTR